MELNMLKEIIKTLSLEQTQLKKDRKTGPYEIILSKYGYVDHTKIPQIVKQSWVANTKILENAIKITAAHNLQHELKGSTYRHNVPTCKQYMYKKEYEALKTSEAQRASLEIKTS